MVVSYFDKDTNKFDLGISALKPERPDEQVYSPEAVIQAMLL